MNGCRKCRTRGPGLGVRSEPVERAARKKPGEPWSLRLILYRFDAARGGRGKNSLCGDANYQADERSTKKLVVFAGRANLSVASC